MNEKLTVLIVDDEKDILDILNKFFSRKGWFNIITETNPLEALNIIDEKHIDLLLTDIMMPEINGIDLLKKVKNKQKDIKVVMMTAYSTIDKVLECEKLGAIDYITKPFSSLKSVENKIMSNLEIK